MKDFKYIYIKKGNNVIEIYKPKSSKKLEVVTLGFDTNDDVQNSDLCFDNQVFISEERRNIERKYGITFKAKQLSIEELLETVSKYPNFEIRELTTGNKFLDIWLYSGKIYSKEIVTTSLDNVTCLMLISDNGEEICEPIDISIWNTISYKENNYDGTIILKYYINNDDYYFLCNNYGYGSYINKKRCYYGDILELEDCSDNIRRDRINQHFIWDLWVGNDINQFKDGARLNAEIVETELTNYVGMDVKIYYKDERRYNVTDSYRIKNLEMNYAGHLRTIIMTNELIDRQKKTGIILSNTLDLRKKIENLKAKQILVSKPYEYICISVDENLNIVDLVLKGKD